MAVQRRINWISQQRVDVPDMRSVESAVSNDFDQLIQAFVTGTVQGYFVRGFNILMAGAIGGAANGLQLNVDPGALLHIAASASGTILMVPTGTSAQPLNAATNTNVSGGFRSKCRQLRHNRLSSFRRSSHFCPGLCLGPNYK